MSDWLFLCHRLPYPPNKGDKIRSYHILRELCRAHRVHLVTFIDDPHDQQYVGELEKLCASVTVETLTPWQRRFRAFAGLVRGNSLSDACYASRRVRARVAELVHRHQPEAIFCYSSPMGQYADAFPGLRRGMDFVDMDSWKWRQYAEAHKPPMSWIYALEHRRLLAREKAIAERYDASWFVTPEERALFLRASGCSERKIGFFRNGVDQQYFDPALAFASPFPPDRRAIVFTGAMDYYANADAVAWFCDEVLPALQEGAPDLWFYIVGSNPSAAVKALAGRPQVVVTGRVPDVRPYLQHAALVVAPMRIARGLQNKVLEALAMNRPVVASPEALEGLVADPLLERLRADGAAAFREKCRQLLRESFEVRSYVGAHYSWSANLVALQTLRSEAT